MMLPNKIETRKNDLLKKLWTIRGHLKIELISLFIICPPFFGMIAVSTFELQKVRKIFKKNIVNNPLHVGMSRKFENRRRNV